MQATPSTPQLQSLLESRRAIETEIANWRGVAADAAAKREAVISDPAALADPSLYDSAARFQQQAEGTSRKAAQLESELPALDERISVACVQVTKELCDHLERLKAERYQDFKNCIGKFWARGTADQWFQPYQHAPRAIRAKVAFEESDSNNEMIRAIAQVVHANTPTERQTPPVRAAKLLALIPQLPPTISTEALVAAGNPNPPEPPAEKPTTTEAPPKSWWFKKRNPSPVQA